VGVQFSASFTRFGEGPIYNHVVYGVVNSLDKILARFNGLTNLRLALIKDVETPFINFVESLTTPLTTWLLTAKHGKAVKTACKI